MARFKTQYECQQCGYAQVGWAGKCPNCGTWGSLVETVVESKGTGNKKKSSSNIKAGNPILLSSVHIDETKRISTGISEFDRVLGGGLVVGQVVLLAGEPGIGKSTILLQVANNMGKTFYVSGEESLGQIKVRAQRLKINNPELTVLEETDVDRLIATAETLVNSDNPPSLIIVDSIQTMHTSDLSGMAGSVGQVRESAFRLTQFAKSKKVPLIIVGQVTKEGSVAGPASLAHLVDTVCWFEGDRDLILRMLRSVKNRFGPTDEVGVFRMDEQGLVSVTDVERLFISSHESVPGSVVTSTLEGTRPILVEIQSLVVKSYTPYPKRIAQGIDPKRLELLLAILTRRTNLPLYEYDVYVNVVGGISIKETASDLAVCLSIASAFKDIPISVSLLAIGEVGLLGEVRAVIGQDRRIKQAKQQGFDRIASSKQFKTLYSAMQALFK